MARRRARKKGSRRRRLARLLYLVILLGAAGFGASLWLLKQVELPPAAVLAETSVLYARDGTPIAELRAEEDRFYLRLDEMAPVLVDAVIAAEDRDFRSHPGVDPLAIGRALWADLRSGRAQQGGSTITQQYVKNVYLDHDRTIWRKVREAALALRLEQELSKDEILERYLNTIYFGRGAYGVEAAARVWFGRSAGELGLPEAAYLAGLIRAPESADADKPEQLPEAERRRDSVLTAMVEEGYITDADADAVRAEPLTADVVDRREVRPVRILPAAESMGIEYFVDLVRRDLVERYGAAAVFGGGLRVTTTIDLDLQRAAWDSVRTTIGREGSPDAALVTVDDQGEIRALVGGADFARSEVNLAVGAEGGGSGRQPGSAFKPILLAEAVREGISLRSLFPSPGTLVLPGADDGRDWTVSNYGGADQGVLDLLDATVVSSNTAYAQLIGILGADRVVDLAEDLGVTAPLEPVPSLALGTEEVSPLDMATAYSVFADGGTRFEPRTVTEVREAPDGDLVDRFSARSHDVLSRQEAMLVTEALLAVVDRGTGTRAAVPGVEIAGKTGTTQDNADAWFVGYTPKATTAVWVGYPDGARPLVDVAGFARVTGGTVPAVIFAKYLGAVAPVIGTGSFERPPELPGTVLNADLATTTGPPTTAPSTTVEPTTAPPTTGVDTTSPPATAPPTTTATTATLSVPATTG